MYICYCDKIKNPDCTIHEYFWDVIDYLDLSYSLKVLIYN